MCDLGALDNLIANTAYLEARKSGDGAGGSGKKRRCSMVLPGPRGAQCADMRTKVAGTQTYAGLCEEQPVGRRLFRQFAGGVPEYAHAVEFLDEAEQVQLSEDGAREGLAGATVAAFLRADSERSLTFLSAELAAAVASAGGREAEELVRRAREEARLFLVGQPFREFLASPFFDRLLQWKVLERQPVSERSFYEFRTLGKGGFGEVCAIQGKLSGKMYACKKLDKKRLKKKRGEQMALLEKEILESVNSPFVVRLAYAYQTKTHLCLVMSLMNGGDLKYHIYEMGERGLSPARTLFYAAQITCGLQHLHTARIVYRDMKPENVLLDERGHCRLSDLGLAVVLADGQETIRQRAGTNGYMSPEVVLEEPYAFDADWFATGCTVYEMICGRAPFKDYREKVSKEEVRRRTLEDAVVFSHPAFTDQSRDLCTLMLAKKAQERLGCRGPDDDPRRHDFFRTVNFQRLEAGLGDPPFVPDPGIVYAKDVGDIQDFSETKGVELDDKDRGFYARFATGPVPLAWQEEMIEMGLFEEVNDDGATEGDRGDGVNGDVGRKSGVCHLL
ncbi:rhodopsin kinase GRK7 [Petromyzon marinus]|uniref:rhodopsin kinase GRK7 n=1 Tax=Petromyzon marinus TaxID=7757 RepID=UPI003F6F6057